MSERFSSAQPWEGLSSDPNDEQFGDVVDLATLDDCGEYDAVLVGEPYDGAVIGRKGAASGPRGLRDALASTKTHHFSAGPVENLADLGDVAIPETDDVSAVQDAVAAVAADVHDADPFPVFLGGDNSLTYANVRPLLEEGSVGVVNFDAHLDVREVRDDVGPTSGTPYRQLIEDGLDAYAAIGVRHFETSTEYHDYLTDNGGFALSAGTVGDDPEAAITEVRDQLSSVDNVYISVDLDVLDSTAAPGVSAPTPGGLRTMELFRMLGALGRDDGVAGFEVVECAPPLDDGHQTARAGARTVAHVLAGVFHHE
jgi:formimidoylglutamase